MNTKSFFSDVLMTIGSALAAAAAVRQGREPDRRNLRALGIDPDQFHTIRRY
jgi:hypothetical protein